MSILKGASALNQIDNQHDERDDEQYVDEPAQRVRAN